MACVQAPSLPMTIITVNGCSARFHIKSNNLSEMLLKQDASPVVDGFKSVCLNFKAEPCLRAFFYPLRTEELLLVNRSLGV
jgi:hypothetical protein